MDPYRQFLCRFKRPRGFGSRGRDDASKSGEKIREKVSLFARVCGVPKLTAEGVGTRDNSHIGKLKMVLSGRCEEEYPDDPVDRQPRPLLPLCARVQHVRNNRQHGFRLDRDRRLLCPSDGRLGRDVEPEAWRTYP